MFSFMLLHSFTVSSCDLRSAAEKEAVKAACRSFSGGSPTEDRAALSAGGAGARMGE